jgi:hypothetical protein
MKGCRDARGALDEQGFNLMARTMYFEFVCPHASGISHD